MATGCVISDEAIMWWQGGFGTFDFFIPYHVSAVSKASNSLISTLNFLICFCKLHCKYVS